MGIMNIGILGAGIVGTTTALEVQKYFHGNKTDTAQITLIADKFNEETTSNGAAGIFRPGTSFSGPDPTTTKKWIAESYKYYNDLLEENCGIKEVSGYILSSISPHMVKNYLLEDIVPIYRPATPKELSLCPGNWKYGSFFQTLLVECRTFLPWALNRFELGGGKILKKTVKNFSELAGKYDIVVNCTGLNAKYLCDDNKLVAIRGQVIKVSAPWLEHFYYGDYDTYIIPGLNGIATLGGSRHYDSYSTSVCQHDRAAILERCYSMLPRLSSASVITTWVGLRPHRDPVRVQLEDVDGLKVVHNYGHGGYGVTVAPGTAKLAATLAMEASSKSKL